MAHRERMGAKDGRHVAARGRAGLARMLAAMLALAPVAAQAQALAIVDARILASPEAEPVERGVVLVRDGRIEAVGADLPVPADAQRIDAAGATVVAGYWNSHIHLIAGPLAGAADRPASELAQALAEQYLRWGFTTVFDIASQPGNADALRGRIAAGEFPGPRVLTVGAPFFPEHGTPVYVLEFDGLGERVFSVFEPSSKSTTRVSSSSTQFSSTAPKRLEAAKIWGSASFDSLMHLA